MITDSLLYEKKGSVVTLTINRPDMRNPLGEEDDANNFSEAARQISLDKDVSCVILTGAGKAFSAGGNIKAMRDPDSAFSGHVSSIADHYRYGIHVIVKSLYNLEVPVIAAVNGPAIGLGNDVACMADIRIASDKAIFGATFLKIGLVPGDGGGWLLPRVIGGSKAAELFFTGETIDAQTALKWGLVSRVVLHEDLLSAANELAEKICRQPPNVLRMTKRLMRLGEKADFDTIMELSANMQSIAHKTEDHQEALSAFMDKRDPKYKGY